MQNNVLDDHIQLLTQSELFQKVSAICAAVNIVSETSELLEVSLARTLELFHAGRGSVFIFDEATEELTLKVAQGLAHTERKQLIKQMGRGVVGQVALLKTPILVKDISQDARFANYRARASYQTSSFICAPLLIKDKLIGVINISDKLSGARFGEADMQLLDFLASQIALNYRRIELYKKFQTILKRSEELTNELGKTNQVTTQLRRQIVAHERLATVGKMAGGIAHEFNNPLDGVMRYTNLCLNHIDPDDDVLRGYLLEIKNGLTRMATIVRNLLACSRRSEKPLQLIHPQAAIEQAVQAVQAEAAHKNIRIDRAIALNVTEIPDQGLERILVNLIRNAVDALPPGGRIRVSAQQGEGRLTIEVADNGPGIPEHEDPTRIFEPFYTTKDIEKGCGLGLTIVSEIVKNYDGQIHVESAPGEGATFIVTLPIG